MVVDESFWNFSAGKKSVTSAGILDLANLEYA
jgi:hypothetical protein